MMKKYHIILLLIACVNLYPFLITEDLDRTRIYGPALQDHLLVEVDGERLNVEHKVHFSAQLYGRIMASSTTFLLIAILYMIIAVQGIRGKANNRAQAIGDKSPKPDP